MVSYPKIVKPPRTYPSANAIMALRLRINQKPAVDPVYGRAPGTSALKAGVPFHVGTIPAGSFILPSLAHITKVFTGTGPALKIGTEEDDDGLLLAADAPLGALAVKDGIINALSGVTAAEIHVWAILSGTAITEGAVDWVCPFYVQRD